jgi:hypothetical protein
MGTWYSVIAPAVVIRPTPALGNSVQVNHSAPSGPAAIRPSWPEFSVNHSAWSGPVVIEVGELYRVGTAIVIRPMLQAPR